jgi:hypothetical protein
MTETDEKERVARVEFGFGRTVCGCAEDVLNCQFIPGYLVPADLPRLAGAAGHTDLLEFARSHLLASPGALVGMADGSTHRIPTLVPARAPVSGYCRFLTAGGLCGVHGAAPYGCAFFDSHMTRAECDRRSAAGLRAIMADVRECGDYFRVWLKLWSEGRRAPDPRASRARMAAALWDNPG